MYIFIYLIKVLYKKKSNQYIFHIEFVDTYFFSIKCIPIYKGIPISTWIILAWLKYNHIQHLLSNLEISMISVYWSKKSMLFDNLIVRFLLFLKIAATIPVSLLFSKFLKHISQYEGYHENTLLKLEITMVTLYCFSIPISMLFTRINLIVRFLLFLKIARTVPVSILFSKFLDVSLYIRALS